MTTLYFTCYGTDEVMDGELIHDLNSRRINENLKLYSNEIISRSEAEYVCYSKEYIE